jgi:hypothetical protein
MTDEYNCWKECVGCVPVRDTSTCKNRTDTCVDSDCATCEFYELDCKGIYCPGFISKCTVCPHFTRNCKKCKHWLDPNKNPEAIRSFLSAKLRPNNTYGRVGKYGVHKITTDGSLLGGSGSHKGAEIITTGRRIDYWEFYKMAKTIIDEALDKGAFVDERCSLHMHVLTSHYISPASKGRFLGEEINEMEKEMPEIILANFHQLCRKYQNAITWMTVGLSDPNHITRWEKFRVSVMEVCAQRPMKEVVTMVSDRCYKEKYGWVNYVPTKFTPDGNISRFHVELRVADGLLSPSAVAAISCLYYSLVIKAVELSRFGTLVLNSEQWYRNAKAVKNTLLNGNGDWDNSRFGDTSGLKKYYSILQEESLELVHQLKSILLRIGPAYDVLEKLATEPCGLRRCRGCSWKKIEEDLMIPLSQEDKVDVELTELITLVQIPNCNNLEDWIKKAITNLNVDEDSIRQFVNTKMNMGELVWAEKVGSPILV